MSVQLARSSSVNVTIKRKDKTITLQCYLSTLVVEHFVCMCVITDMYVCCLGASSGQAVRTVNVS